LSGYVAKPLNQSPLIEFLLGSFHPDWMLNDPDAESVVRDFVRVQGPSSSEVDALIADIGEVLAEYPTDAKLRALIADHLVPQSVVSLVRRACPDCGGSAYRGVLRLGHHHPPITEGWSAKRGPTRGQTSTATLAQWMGWHHMPHAREGAGWPSDDRVRFVGGAERRCGE
jgi:hypothetical protein